VTYTYTPRTLAAIPETPTWAEMLVGFASLGFAGYRAKRKGRASNTSVCPIRAPVRLSAMAAR
jgi:hypothetical protein